jgi:DNA repair exonuclease SbcCD ATPase subunit
MALDPVTFNMLSEFDSDPVHSGFIAQDVEKISPDLVSTGADGMKGLSYAMFAPLLTKAIQEQQTLITHNAERITQVDLNITQTAQSTSDLQAAVNDKLNIISSSLTSLDKNVTSYGLRVTEAEQKLREAENNLTTFQAATNDTLSAMLETENMLTHRVLDHEDRLKALEDQLATMTITGGDPLAGGLPTNVITQDASGNVTLAGIFKAKEIKSDSIETKTATVTNLDA